ncbi:MAG: thiamine phosphate synthase [Akkermansia sp.]
MKRPMPPQPSGNRPEGGGRRRHHRAVPLHQSGRGHLLPGRPPIRDFLASRGVPFIVNNRIDLALALDADGVHIGQRDLPVPAVRAMIGPDRILGLSVSNADQLRAVDAALVDYLGMGPVFPTISS